MCRGGVTAHISSCQQCFPNGKCLLFTQRKNIVQIAQNHKPSWEFEGFNCFISVCIDKLILVWSSSGELLKQQSSARGAVRMLSKNISVSVIEFLIKVKNIFEFNRCAKKKKEKKKKKKVHDKQ